mgnify:CR=1 FL=1
MITYALRSLFRDRQRLAVSVLTVCILTTFLVTMDLASAEGFAYALLEDLGGRRTVGFVTYLSPEVVYYKTFEQLQDIILSVDYHIVGLGFIVTLPYRRVCAYVGGCCMYVNCVVGSNEPAGIFVVEEGAWTGEGIALEQKCARVCSASLGDIVTIEIRNTTESAARASFTLSAVYTARPYWQTVTPLLPVEDTRWEQKPNIALPAKWVYNNLIPHALSVLMFIIVQVDDFIIKGIDWGISESEVLHWQLEDALMLNNIPFYGLYDILGQKLWEHKQLSTWLYLAFAIFFYAPFIVVAIVVLTQVASLQLERQRHLLGLLRVRGASVHQLVAAHVTTSIVTATLGVALATAAILLTLFSSSVGLLPVWKNSVILHVVWQEWEWGGVWMVVVMGVVASVVYAWQARRVREIEPVDAVAEYIEEEAREVRAGWGWRILTAIVLMRVLPWFFGVSTADILHHAGRSVFLMVFAVLWLFIGNIFLILIHVILPYVLVKGVFGLRKVRQALFRAFHMVLGLGYGEVVKAVERHAARLYRVAFAVALAMSIAIPWVIIEESLTAYVMQLGPQSGIQLLQVAGGLARWELILGSTAAAMAVATPTVAAVVERRRELGLWRVRGANRRFIVRLVGFEGLVAVLIGLLVGVAAGLTIGYGLILEVNAMLHIMEPELGAIQLVVPWELVVELVGIAGVLLFVSLLPAIIYARRASIELIRWR